MGTIGITIVLICEALWSAIVMLIRKWRFNARFLVANLAPFLICQTLIWTTGIVDIGHDRYGYSIIFASFFSFLFHTAVAFAISIVINLSHNKEPHAHGQNLTE